MELEIEEKIEAKKEKVKKILNKEKVKIKGYWKMLKNKKKILNQ